MIQIHNLLIRHLQCAFSALETKPNAANFLTLLEKLAGTVFEFSPLHNIFEEV